MPASPGIRIPQRFQSRWAHLGDPPVGTLAWLLDAPGLLDPDAPQWRGRIATLEPPDAETCRWLAALDRAPRALHAFLGLQPFTRLGRYAEKLMAFYLGEQGRLVAHGVQVRSAGSVTIGEFDFLLHDGGNALLHWEFATKLYLLETSGDGCQADYFVGPNLADTLGAKMRKIMDRQLALSLHPAAQAYLPAPVAAAQALVKGWLFYHGRTPLQPPGVSPAHCRGFWCALEELGDVVFEYAMVLPRLEWLAPAKAAPEKAMDRKTLADTLHAHFAADSMPVLIALLAARDGWMTEIDRGFVVPDDWRNRAARRIKSG